MPYRPVQFTDAQADDAVRRYESGESSASIARSLGCSPATFRNNVLRPRGITPNITGRKLTPQQRDEVARRYAAGESMRSLSREFDCSSTNIRFLAKARGVPLRRSGRPAPPDEVLDLIRQRREQGISHQRIADELGRPEQWVLVQCRRMGLPGDPAMSGPAHYAWKGGRVVHRGYALVWVDPADPLAVMASTTGYAPEHRLVMARSLGRTLTRRETVHHINGDKLDNRLENLQLRQGNHGAGVRMTCYDCGSHNIGAAPL